MSTIYNDPKKFGNDSPNDVILVSDFDHLKRTGMKHFIFKYVFSIVFVYHTICVDTLFSRFTMHSIFRFGTALLLFCTLQLALVFSVRGQDMNEIQRAVSALESEIVIGTDDPLEPVGVDTGFVGTAGSASALESEPAASGSVLFYNMWNIFTLLFASLVAMYRLF